MTPEEARLAAHICGDGCLSIWIEKNGLQIVHGRKYRQRRTRYEIIYSNNEIKLLNQFAGDLRKVFGVKPRLGKDEVRTRSKRIFEHLKRLGGGGTYEWKIPRKIQDSTKKIKTQWITAFFDDEGTVDLIEKRVRIKNMNYKGLRQLVKLLEGIGIVSKITGPNADRSWWLTISGSGALTFARNIRIEHTKKRKQLASLLAHFLAK